MEHIATVPENLGERYWAAVADTNPQMDTSSMKVPTALSVADMYAEEESRQELLRRFEYSLHVGYTRCCMYSTSLLRENYLCLFKVVHHYKLISQETMPNCPLWQVSSTLTCLEVLVQLVRQGANNMPFTELRSFSSQILSIFEKIEILYQKLKN